MTALELSANAVTAASIGLAARHHVLTWPVGIVGCVLFAWQFHAVQLYADASLQVFFIATSLWGWWHWQRSTGPARPVSGVAPGALAAMAVAAVLVAAGYGWLLQRHTDAYLPYVDAAVLAASVVAQILLMRRQVQTWPAWLVVNTLAVPLFASRGLWLTAALYAAYWLNAWYGWWHWRRLARAAA